MLLSHIHVFAQYSNTRTLDSLYHQLNLELNDTTKVNVLNLLSALISSSNPDSSYQLANKALQIASKPWRGMNEGWLPGKARAYHNIGLHYLNIADYPKAFEQLNLSLQLYTKLNSKNKVAEIHDAIGSLYQRQNRKEDALKHFKISYEMYLQLNLKKRMGYSSRSIGNIYLIMKDSANSHKYYQQGYDLFESEHDSIGMAAMLNNLAFVYDRWHGKQKEEEITCYKKALQINLQIGNQIQAIHNLINIGMTLRQKLNRVNEGIYYLKKAREIPGPLPMNTISIFYNLSMSYQSLASNDTALMHAGVTKTQALKASIQYIDSAIELSTSTHNLNYLYYCYQHKSDILEELSDFKESKKYYTLFIQMRDSVTNVEKERKQAQTEMKFELEHKQDSMRLVNEKHELLIQKEADLKVLHAAFEQKQAEAKNNQERQRLKFEEAIRTREINFNYQKKLGEANARVREREVRRKEEQIFHEKEMAQQGLIRNMIFAGLAISLSLLILVYLQRNRIKKEKLKSETLLHNILPEEIAHELKRNGSSVAKQFEQVTVLFTDFVNFTSLSEQMNASELVETIHRCFTAFDGIMEQYGIEKIKTIGDAYLAVTGLPVAMEDHAERMVNAALAINKYMDTYGGVFKIRIGINSGPVVAGIVGVKKYAYDIWGDTVNTAARMEQHSEPGMINISESTYQLVKNRFNFTDRGKIKAKNKGEIHMYFVNSTINS